VEGNGIRIGDYRAEDAASFRSLNEDWIRKYFTMEAPDYAALGSPEEHILRPGGRIFMAFEGEKAIGCCALIRLRPGVFELAKMTVAEDYRGRGIGRKILEHTIEQARALGAGSLVLASNQNLKDAVHLYEAMGFRHLSPDAIPPSPYGRTDVFMELGLR